MRLRLLATCVLACALLPACKPADRAAPADDDAWKFTVTPKNADSPLPNPLAPTGDAAFDTAYAQAQANERQSGYDPPLSRALSNSRLADALAACQVGHEDRNDVRGYFDFPAHGAYRMVAQPATPFTACVIDAFEGLAVPEPPRRPYVHAVNFYPASEPVGP